MEKREVMIVNETGLHARPASEFARAAQQFECDIFLINNDKEYNAKSIVSILMMGANKGTSVIIKAEGRDEKEAVIYLANMIEKSFNE